MNTYLFTFTIEPTNNTWWDTRRNETVKIQAESLKAAKVEFLEVLEDKYYFEISKTASKNPSKMYRDTKEGTKQVGFVYKASTEIEWSREKPWKKVYANIWAEINILNNPFEA